MSVYKIVNLLLESEDMPFCYEAFRCEETEAEERAGLLPVTYVPLSHLADDFTPVSEVSGLRIGEGEKGWIFEDIETGNRMRIPKDYSSAQLSEGVKEQVPLQRFLLQLFIEGRLLDEGVITLHSSCIELEGKAYAFSGPSGCGKSTRARRWVWAFGAEYISGDRPAVSIMEKTVHGIPWDGKEQIFTNRSAELAAIFEVRRSPFTRLRRLSEEQARRFLISQLYIPMWDSERAFQAMLLLGRLVKSFPVFRLFCDQDENAARETKTILTLETDNIQREETDMKLNEGFVLKSMAGESVLMPTGTNIVKFNGTVMLNEVSAFIIKRLEAGPCSLEDLADLLLKEYDVDRETVLKDLEELTEKLAQMGVLSLEA